MATQYDRFRERVKVIEQRFAKDPAAYKFIEAFLEQDYGWDPEPGSSKKTIDSQFSLRITEGLEIDLLSFGSCLEIDDTSLLDDKSMKLNKALNDVEAAMDNAETMYLNTLEEAEAHG